MTYPSPGSFYAQGTGTAKSSYFVPVFQSRSPTTNDINYEIGQKWINQTTNTEWTLFNFTSFNGSLQAIWQETTGDVIGPPISTINGIAKWADTTGLVLANSEVTIDSFGNVNFPATVNIFSTGFNANLTDGQLLIGSTGNNAVASTLTAGSNINITNGPGSIIISAPSSGGDVNGPASSLSNTIAIFADTTGKLLADTGVSIDASNNTIIPGNLNVSFTNAGNPVSLTTVNNSATSNSHAVNYIEVQTSGGNAVTTYEVLGTQAWTSGINQGSSNHYQISAFRDLTSNIVLDIAPSAGTFYTTWSTPNINQSYTQAGSQVIYLIENTSSAANSYTTLQIASTGSLAGDAFTQYTVLGVKDWVCGIDNSDAQKFKISNSGVLGTNDSIVIDTSSNVSIPSGSLSTIGPFTVSHSNSGSPTLEQIINTSATLGSDATTQWLVENGGGDAKTQYTVQSIQDWVSGLDQSDSNSYVISSSNTLGTSNRFRISTSGTVSVPSGGILQVPNNGFDAGLTNGQLLIGNTGSVATATTLTAGTNISITNGSGSITINSSNPGGDVVGPVSSTNNTVATFSGTTGKVIQGTGVTIDGSNNLTVPVSATLTIPSNGFNASLTNGQIFVGSTGVNAVATTLTAGSNISVTNGAGSVSIATTANPSFSTLTIPSNGFNASLTNGQLLIGSTGVNAVASTLTAGSNITITNAPGSITIAAAGGISGPGSTTNNAIAIWNGTTGSALNNSSLITNANGDLQVGGVAGNVTGTLSTDAAKLTVASSGKVYLSGTVGVTNLTRTGAVNVTSGTFAVSATGITSTTQIFLQESSANTNGNPYPANLTPGVGFNIITPSFSGAYDCQWIAFDYV